MNYLRRLPRALAYVVAGAARLIIGNIGLAVLSLALALSLWLFVTDRENPTEAQTFNSAIPVRFVNVPNGLAVANASESTVRIRIEAPKNELRGLSVDDFDATIDLGGLSRGVQTVTVAVNPPNSDVNVIDITPARIDVTIEDVRTKEVPVRPTLVGSPQQGFAATNERADPATATVSGPESLVALVDAAVAEVNLTGLRVDFTDDRVELAPRDARGGEISRVQVNPQAARVTVDIEQREFSFEFVVTPAVTGQPAAGYNLAGITIEPRLAVVTGPLDVLQSIDAVRGIGTEEISVADARDDVIRTVRLALPEGTRAQGSPDVRVAVHIDAAQGEFSFRVVPQVRNLDSALTATVADAVTVTLAGEVPLLQSLTPESILAIADVQGLGAGLHLVPVNVSAPGNTTIIRIDPGQAGIALAPRP